MFVNADENTNLNYSNYREELIEELGFDPTSSYCELPQQYSTYSIASTTYVYTPNNTQVSVIAFSEDLSTTDIEYLNVNFDNLFLNATRLSTSTRYYNCHSYAWYKSMTTNPYWMNDPSAYYTDESYYEVSQPQAGDIICYYDSSNSILHSGAIISIDSTINGLSSIIEESKWGSCGLYRHRADYCPYMPNYGGDTAYVKYYRHTRHTYNQECEYYNNSYHKTYCLCGDYIFTKHTVKASQISGQYARCLGCGSLIDLNDDLFPALPFSWKLN